MDVMFDDVEMAWDVGSDKFFMECDFMLW